MIENDKTLLLIVGSFLDARLLFRDQTHLDNFIFITTTYLQTYFCRLSNFQDQSTRKINLIILFQKHLKMIDKIARSSFAFVWTLFITKQIRSWTGRWSKVQAGL